MSKQLRQVRFPWRDATLALREGRSLQALAVGAAMVDRGLLDILDALRTETSQQILLRLGSGSLTVRELADTVHRAPGTVRHSLARLRQSNLVTCHGSPARYELSPSIEVLRRADRAVIRARSAAGGFIEVSPCD